ncbi:hypothetical protein [Streptomyces cylindrosporus]|uniref:Uncharacterized protein n=1 Tax=Streptomyces cylindrosporus TaxID=2927583 RepID=A0ABS9YJY7_9ACTN|nr:hypothetical protein [Streptomyces cylindrosporus]MCI3277485.1 hypothetical protein [Streptomyces cylindrosporus]
MTMLAPEPISTDTVDDGITHLVCCKEDIALCGTDVSGEPYVTEDVPIDCVVCLDFEACPVCGSPIDSVYEQEAL